MFLVLESKAVALGTCYNVWLQHCLVFEAPRCLREAPSCCQALQVCIWADGPLHLLPAVRTGSLMRMHTVYCFMRNTLRLPKCVEE